MKSEYVFAIAGLLSAILTILLGARWLLVLVLGAGLIFGVVLFVTERLFRQRRSSSAHARVARRLLAAVAVTLAYPCGVAVFITLLSLSDRPLMVYWNIGSLIAAGVIATFLFYWALGIIAKTTWAVLYQLLIIAVLTALISGSAESWGKEFLMVRPHWFVSPFWVSLLLIGETGFAWVWGRSLQSSAPSIT